LPAVPHAYTRASPAVFAWSIACPTVAYGAMRDPAVPAASLPVGATKTPKVSVRMQGSAVSEGSSVFSRQSLPHTWAVPTVQVTPQVGGAMHEACPFPDGGAGQALPHDPQWFGSVAA
jgi:hypothetical protein